MSVRNDVRNTVSYNVVGRVPGSKRPDEAFVYTAHWDHLGKTANAKPGEDAIFNGAQDNATGVSALIELGRAFAATKPAPERSLMFVAVTAEESGLLGSEYFAAHPPIPVAQMVGGLNMDNLYSVGKTRDITVIGFGKSELEDDLRAAAAKQGRVPVQEPSPEKGFYYRSDHFNLAKAGVPMLYTKAGIDSPTLGAEYGKQWLADYTAKRYHQVIGRVLARLGRERHAAGPAAVLRRGAGCRELVAVAELARGQRVSRDQGPEPQVARDPADGHAGVMARVGAVTRGR